MVCCLSVTVRTMHLCPFSIGSTIIVRLKKLEGGSKSDFPRARSQVPANGSLDWPNTERPILANSTAKTRFRHRFITFLKLTCTQNLTHRPCCRFPYTQPLEDTDTTAGCARRRRCAIGRQ